MTSETAIRWRRESPDFLRSQCGRFDVLRSEAVGDWVAIDWDMGRRFRAHSVEACAAWCQRRAA